MGQSTLDSFWLYILCCRFFNFAIYLSPLLTACQNFDLEIVSPECTFDVGFWKKYYAQMLFPFVIGVALALVQIGKHIGRCFLCPISSPNLIQENSITAKAWAIIIFLVVALYTYITFSHDFYIMVKKSFRKVLL